MTQPFKPGLRAVPPGEMELNTLYHFARAGRLCTVVRQENGVYQWAVLHTSEVCSGGEHALKYWSQAGVHSALNRGEKV